jgi:hypothetical protein
MASFGHGTNVVVVLYIGGPNTSYDKLVFQREPKKHIAWFPSGIVLSKEEYVDVVTRDFF